MTKTVLITGSSSGFGRHSVGRFVAEGWNVVATLRDPSQSDVRDSERLSVVALDVRDDASVAAAVASATESFGRLDVVVNNAGMGLFSVFESTPPDVIADLFDTNVFGPMRVMRAALPVFRAQRGGRVVNVTSSSATVPNPLQACYGATKAALQSFSESVGYELAHLGVDVKVVEPGFVPTTGFFAQTSTRFASIAVPDDYLPVVEKQMAAFTMEPPAGYLAAEDDVADAVFAAATDVTGTSRFRVGGDAVDAASARRQPDAEYDAWRAELFASA